MASFTAKARFKFDVITHRFTAKGRMKFNIQETRSQKGRWKFRAENDSLNIYELYRGTNTAPDFTAAPFETFTSLPHTTAALTGGPVKYHFVLRKRNQHNLISKNITEFILELDGSEDRVAVKPSNAQEVAIQPALAGAVRVTALYFAGQDLAANRADKFLVYLTDDGVDPDPDTDTPTEVDMVDVDGVVKLDFVPTTFADAKTIKTIVRTRNSGAPDIDSDSLTVFQTISDVDGPVAPDGSIFFRSEAEQFDV